MLDRILSDNHFPNLPDEILMNIFSFLGPHALTNFAQVNSSFKSLAFDNSFWKAKFAKHFPHVFHSVVKDKSKQSSINWFYAFNQAYVRQYKELSKEGKKLFSFVKEGDLAGLKTANFADLYLLVDANGFSPLDWAIKLKQQHILDYIYQTISELEYTNEDNQGHVDAIKKGSKGRTLLHWAILCNQSKEVIEELILKGADINAVQGDGCTPLHLAAEHGYDQFVEILLNLSADTTIKSNDQKTPIEMAFENKHIQVVNALLKTDVSQSQLNYFLFLAAKYGQSDVVKELIARGASVQCTDSQYSPINIAAQNGYLDVVKILIAQDVSIVNETFYGHFPLFSAAKNGHAEIVNFLLANGAQSNQTNRGLSSLMAAAEHGHTSVVKILIKNGAKVNPSATDHLRITPLYLAAKNGHYKIVKLLIAAKAKVDLTHPCEQPNTPLYIASANNHLEVVKALIAGGAKPYQTFFIRMFSLQKDTPLYIAAKNGNVEIVKFLLANGADVNASRYGYDKATALHAAAENGHVEVIGQLLDHGACIEASLSHTTFHKKTPLYLAAEHGHLSAVKTLLENGANPNKMCPLKNNNGGRDNEGHWWFDFYNRPLHIAALNGHDEVTNVLIKHGAKVQSYDMDLYTHFYIDANLPLVLKKQNLDNYLEQTNQRTDDHYHHTFNFFGSKINFRFFGSCSAGEKRAAAVALKSVINGEADKSTLDKHQRALRQGRLKSISRGLY